MTVVSTTTGVPHGGGSRKTVFTKSSSIQVGGVPLW
jgi:hypothetical protein